MISTDPQNWQNPDEFDGFRFAKLRDQEGQPHKYQFVTTNSSHSMAFGHGKHACPGRFFAANEIKTISAYLIRHYDLKAPDDWNGRPASLIFGHNLSPNPMLNILMRRRGE
jgi:cytochrome P450